MQTFVVKLASGVAALVVSICLSLSHLSSNTDADAAVTTGGSVARGLQNDNDCNSYNRSYYCTDLFSQKIYSYRQENGRDYKRH